MWPRCACRWSEVTRRLELWVQLMELNEAGEFTTVDVVPAKDVRTGGIFQLRQVSAQIYQNIWFHSELMKLHWCQRSVCVTAVVLSMNDSPVNLYLKGQSRRIQVEVRSVPDSGTMPLIPASILSVSIGDVKVQPVRPSRGGESHWVRRKSVVDIWGAKWNVLCVCVCESDVFPQTPETFLYVVWFFNSSLLEISGCGWRNGQLPSK